MIHSVEGNILLSNAEALVNPVNCVGVMGRGLALQFKKKFPENFKAYATACSIGDVRIGKSFVFDTGSKLIVNFPTKYHWKNESDIEYIDCGLKDLIDIVIRRNVSSIAIPPIGCGLGKLNWSVVRPRIIHEFTCLAPDTKVLLYESVNLVVPIIKELIIKELAHRLIKWSQLSKQSKFKQYNINIVKIALSSLLVSGRVSLQPDQTLKLEEEL